MAPSGSAGGGLQIMWVTGSGIQYVLVSNGTYPLEGAVAEEERKSSVHMVADSSHIHTLGYPTNTWGVLPEKKKRRVLFWLLGLLVHFPETCFLIFSEIRSNSEICFCCFKRIRFVYESPQLRSTKCYCS